VSTAALTVHQLRYEQRVFWRTPATVAFGFAMPIVLLVIFATINESQPLADDPVDFAQTFVPRMIAFGIVSACYGNLAARFIYRRESGLLLRVRSTPLPVAALVGGFIANAVIVASLLAATLLAAGALLYGVTVPGSWLVLILSIAVGAVSCCALGLAVSTFVPDIDAADPVVFATLLPVAFISGVFMDVAQASVLGRVAAAFPVRHLLDAVNVAFDRDVASTVALRHLAVVAVWGLAAAVVAVRRFRWEPSRR
jgi:ABC-2 type transport system permease protein